MPIVIGNFDYFGIPFPLVLGDRFFHIFKTSYGFNLDIFRWDEKSRYHTYEVINGNPVPENITWNPNGVITFKQISPKLFIYKLLLKPIVISGKTPLNNKEFVVKIDDHEITVIIDNATFATFMKNQVEGPIGLKVGMDGSHVLGVSKLPEGMVLKRGYLVKK